MSTILVYSENPHAAAEMLVAARQLAPSLNASTAALHLGSMTEQDLKAYSTGGAELVYHVDGVDAEKHGPACVAEALANVARNVDAVMVLVAATRLGREVAPRTAQRLKTGYAAECAQLEASSDGLVAYRGVLGGTYQAKLLFKRKPYVVSLQTGRYQPEGSGSQPRVEKVSIEITAPQLELVEIARAESAGVDLEKAELIVSVGRGFKKREDLSMAEELAKVIGAELGCSRPIAGDLKWLPEDRHIGLSGKRVKPKLYLALGISGQVQHLVGIRDSKVVIAVNTDSNAPIMSEADYAVVGDIYKVVPLLTENLKKLLGR